MRSRMMPVLLVLLGWILSPGVAHAVALGKIDVTSHLGEPFYAEVPLQLEKGEKLSGVTVSIAQPDDYRILEVYRDPALNSIRTDIQDDVRGPRIKLISDTALESPFFNLVLKVHYGNATSFKKYPVFLDLPNAIVSTAKPAPKVQAVKKPEAAPVAVETSQSAATTKPVPAGQKGAAPFKPYSGWARIGRYGPMVYGDTLMTVARRLRVDDRYTIKQVMVSLFDKNRDEFDKGNMNLIKAGAYLDVPTAKEVEAITPQHARKVVAEQEKQWRALKKQPRYAAVAEAQKTRYSGRVKIGEVAEGVPAAAAPGKATQAAQQVAASPARKGGTTPAAVGSAAKPTKGTTADQTASELQTLKQQNTQLQQKLQQADQNIAALNARLSSPDVAATQASMKKLELRLARMQTQLDAARQQAAMAAKNNINNMLLYGLGGAVVLLLAVIGYLLRRERPHPAAQLQSESEEESYEDTFAASAAAPFEAEEEEVTSFGMEPAEETPVPQESPSDEERVTDDEAEPEVAEAAQYEAPVEVDPNVDYVAESDVYLRYGMEDEALRQLKMAIRQRDDNVDAHCKLVKLLQARGEQDALATATEAARSALSGSDLNRFEAELVLPEGGAAAAAEPEEEVEVSVGGVDFDQEITGAISTAGEPEEDSSGLPGAAAGEDEAIGEVDLSDSGDTSLEMSGLEWSFDEEEEDVSSTSADTAPSEPETAEAEGVPEVDGGLSFDTEPETTSSDEAGIGDEADTSIAFDVSDLDLDLGEGDEAVVGPGEATEVAGEEAVQPAAGESEGIDLDLSDLMLDEDSAETAEELPETPDEPVQVPVEEDESSRDVSLELDQLLDELALDNEADRPHAEDVSPEALPIDTARSQLASGKLDEAEAGFQSALDGDYRCQGLLGLAELAQQRGDKEKASQMLDEAEPLLDEDSRGWFDELKGKQGE